MSAEGPPPPAAPCGRPGRLLEPVRTRTGMASLLREGSGSACDVRLKLTKEVLTIQKQDVVCVGGSSHGAHGGAEHRVPVVISRIFRGHAADQTGMLFVGDAVLQVNGINVENATHEEVAYESPSSYPRTMSRITSAKEILDDLPQTVQVGAEEDSELQSPGVRSRMAQVHLLRNAGDEVTITVEYLRDAPSFLKLPLGSPGPASDHGSRACSPLFDSGLHLNGNPSSTAPSSPSSPVANEPKYEKHWIDTLSVPLSMARISRCKAGAEKLSDYGFATALQTPSYMPPALACCGTAGIVTPITLVDKEDRPQRSGAFEVLALDGVSTGILQFHTAQESTDWLRAVSANIGDLTLQTMRVANECCSPCDQVVHMGWVSERLEGTGSCHTFRPKFLALKGSSLHVFSIPPVSTLDWVQAEKTYNLCEVLFKLHKIEDEDNWVNVDSPKLHKPQRQLSHWWTFSRSQLWLSEDCWLHTDLGLGPHGFEDPQPYCFSVLVSHGQSRIFSVELGSELATWERSFQRATFMEVQRTGSRTYACSWQGETLCFTVDFALGFTCFDSKTKNVLWRFKFSQLKGSSDDGNTRVKLLFQHLDTRQIEVKELEFPDLTAVLHCVHAFLAAKVASVDPAFLDSQSIARKVFPFNAER